MPIPAFTIDGVLPPFVGANGPGGAPSDMTPYEVTPLEVVAALGHTDARRVILTKWLEHRAALRALGVVSGFQWLDGSFCEDKIPNDLDIVTLFYRPTAAVDDAQLMMLRAANPTVFQRTPVKRTYNLDAFFVDLNSHPTSMIDYTRYLLGLFSHRRGDSLWKGMLQVDLSTQAADGEALAELDRLEGLAAAGELEGERVGGEGAPPASRAGGVLATIFSPDRQAA